MPDARPPIPDPAEHVEDLLRGASTLLDAGAYLDAIHVLHVEIARALGGADSSSVPPHYESRSQAQQTHRRLLAAWRGPERAPAWGRMVRQSWQRRPLWALRVG